MKHLLLCLLLPSLMIAQHKQLSIGDKIPEELITSLTNKLQTPNFKPQTANTLLVLDFFATWCTGCIKALPKLDSLQKKFKGRFNSLLITCQSKQEIEAFRKKNKLFANCTLPIITNDTIFKQLFPHIYLPHEVWVNENGKILAITGDAAITHQNIQSFLNGNSPKLPVKIDAMDFERAKPLLVNGNGGTDNDLLYRSTFTRFLKGIGKSSGITRSVNGTRYYFINHSILDLYQAALGFPLNRIILEVKDTAQYLLTGEAGQETKLFSYELTVPAGSSKQKMKQCLQADLDRYLNLHGRIEKRKTNCWTVIRSNNNDSSIKTKNGKAYITTIDSSGIRIYINQPVERIITALNGQNTPSVNKPIFINETGIIFNIDIQLPPASCSDINTLKQTLAQYGLSLTAVEREIEMFVLTEPGQER